MWEFGDQGSILLLANDEQATDRVIYTTNEGMTWSEYVFGDTIRVTSIVTVPTDTSRKFMLMGFAPSNPDASIVIHLDFSKLTNVKCKCMSIHMSRDKSESLRFLSQATLILAIPTAMTSNSGRPALNERSNVCSDDRHCTIGAFETETAISGNRSSSHIASRETACARMQISNGTLKKMLLLCFRRELMT